MFPQALNPFSRRAPSASYPYYSYPYGRPSLLAPFGSSLGFGLTAAGLMIILHMIAPQLLEQMVPGWQQRFGVIVAVAVVLGFLRSLLRLLLPVASLAFWGIAIYALAHAALPGTDLLPRSLPSVTASAPAPQAATPIRLHGTPALPDAAYFPNRDTSSSSMPVFGSQSKSWGGLNALKRLFM